MDFPTVLALSTSLFITYSIWRKYTRRKLPPGPRGLPFIGNLFQLDAEHPHQILEKWGTQYKDIFKVTLLGQDKVVLSGDYVRHALITDTDSFAGRARFVRVTDIFLKNCFTIGFSDPGPKWQKVKKAVTSVIRKGGDGLKGMEALILENGGEMVSVIDSYKSEPFDPQDLIQQTIVKIIFNLIYGEVLSTEDAQKLLETERRSVALTSIGGYGTELEFLPFLKHFRYSYVKVADNIQAIVQSIHRPAIEACKADINRNCIAGAVLRYNDSVHRPEERMSDLDQIYTLTDIAFGGMSSSAAAIYSLLALLLTYPEVTVKIQAEIDDVIGSRVARIDDSEHMPYLNAVILELLRIISHIPLLLPHATTREVEIGGYTLPKGQEVWVNVWSLHHDPRFWDDPEVFKPERFLTDDGHLLSARHPRRQRLLPFGVGRRFCPGENIAKNRIFILVCMIFQKYDILPESEDKLPISDPRRYKASLVLRPDSFKMRFNPRS